MSESMRRRRRLYVVMASDTVQSSQIPMYTENTRTEILRIANPRKTKHWPGSCILFHGMYLLLFSKKCARLGLMNGCASILEDILTHDREVLPSRSEVGEVIPLQFMPTALLLRAEDAKWTLHQKSYHLCQTACLAEACFCYDCTQPTSHMRSCT